MHVLGQGESEAMQAAISEGFTGITGYIFGREPPPDAGPTARASQAAVRMLSSHVQRENISASNDGEANNQALHTSSGADSGLRLSLQCHAPIPATGGRGRGPSQGAAVSSDALTLALGPNSIDLEQSPQSELVPAQVSSDEGAELPPHVRWVDRRTETAPQTNRMRTMFQFL